jgi:hypothetical protein
VLGQTRKWAYLLVEAAAWAFWLDRRASGGHYRDQYRDLAWEAARLGTVPRVDGDFGYYETLTHWTRSGAFDRNEAEAGVQPEEDPSTFNGSIWNLATQIFLPAGAPVDKGSPGYDSALDYYQERAYDARFLWDWGGAEAARGRFADLIERSDSRFRQATTALGIVIANHLLSAADGYLSARGARVPAVRLTPAPASRPGGPSWWAVASFAVSP